MWGRGYINGESLSEYLVSGAQEQLVVYARLGKDVRLVQNFGRVEIVEDVHDAPPVPVIRDTPTIINVTGCIF